MQRIKLNDLVHVITGKDCGKQGHVIEVDLFAGKVKVRGIAMVTRHVKARRQGEKSSIRREEGFIHMSNVMPVDDQGKPCRVRFAVQDGRKVRVSARTGQPL
jgi:large subunit ribosomal protein L24